MKIRLTATYEYFMRTNHLKLIQNNKQIINHYRRDMEHSVIKNDLFIIRLAISLQNYSIIKL